MLARKRVPRTHVPLDPQNLPKINIHPIPFPPPISSAGGCSPGMLLPDHDLDGGPSNQKVADVDACAALCQDTEYCTAYVYVLDSVLKWSSSVRRIVDYSHHYNPTPLSGMCFARGRLPGQRQVPIAFQPTAMYVSHFTPTLLRLFHFYLVFSRFLTLTIYF